MNDLVKKSSKIFFGSAIAGAGFSLGRDTYKFIKKKFIIFLAIIVFLSAIIMPFFSSSKSFRWYEMSRLEYFFLVFLPWHLAGLSFSFLAYYIYSMLNNFLSHEQIINEAFSKDYVLFFSIVVSSLLYITGVLDGLRRRSVRMKAHEIEQYNASFMEQTGITEIDGGKSFTHEDSEGNMLRLEGMGKDIVEFFVVGRRNKRSYIDIDSEGRFIGYSGIV